MMKCPICGIIKTSNNMGLHAIVIHGVYMKPEMTICQMVKYLKEQCGVIGK